MFVMTDGKHATATSGSWLSTAPLTTPFKSEAGVWFVIPSISVDTFSGGYLEDDQSGSHNMEE